MPDSKSEYQWQTSLIHLALGVSSLTACLPLLWTDRIPSWVGLLLSGLTNLVIAWEKWDIYRKGKS